jgi:uncharacterized membrane protein
MANPFDPRTVLLARHAQHVVLIHFPIALFITGVLFDLLSRGNGESAFAKAAYLNISGAALTVIPAAITGLLAWQFALEGKRIKGVLLLHMLAASASILLLLISWWMHRSARKDHRASLPAYRIAIELLGVVIIAITAHLGGFLSGVNF